MVIPKIYFGLSRIFKLGEVVSGEQEQHKCSQKISKFVVSAYSWYNVKILDVVKNVLRVILA